MFLLFYILLEWDLKTIYQTTKKGGLNFLWRLMILKNMLSLGTVVEDPVLKSTLVAVPF